jgi:hypothetical protein
MYSCYVFTGSLEPASNVAETSASGLKVSDTLTTSSALLRNDSQQCGLFASRGSTGGDRLRQPATCLPLSLSVSLSPKLITANRLFSTLKSKSELSSDGQSASLPFMFKFKLYCGWRSVGQFVLMSGPFWGPWSDFNFLCLAITFLLLHVGRPLWREDWPVICSAITHWLESRRTHNHVLLPHLRPPQFEGPGRHIYIQERVCKSLTRCLRRFPNPYS